MTAAVIAACDATDERREPRDRGGPGLIRLRGEKSDAKRALDDAGNISVGGRQLSRAAVYLRRPSLRPASPARPIFRVTKFMSCRLLSLSASRPCCLTSQGGRFSLCGFSPRRQCSWCGTRACVRGWASPERASLALMNRVSNRPFSLQVVSQAEGSECCMDGSGRGTAMICLPVVHFNDGRIDGRLNAASAHHHLPRSAAQNK